jgi:gluconate 2-dehydrogenase gamma chain
VSDPRQNAGQNAGDKPNTTINRRSLMLGAVFMLGGAAALTRFVRQPGSGDELAVVFSPEQFALLEQVADVIIPRTDTPGALEAGVPAFIHQMLAEWASPNTRADIINVLENIERRAWNTFGAAFRELPGERRLEVVRAIDEEGMAREDLAYGKFKSLVLVGYYHSEIGATQELRYELVPGAWRSCLPLTEVGRASAV